MQAGHSMDLGITNTSGLVALITERLLAISNFVDGATPARLPEAVLASVHGAILSRKPIQFILPAFPAKSANRQKTHSPAPDLGEVRSLIRLNEFCEAVSRIYAPGAQMLICSDGRVFNDLVGVPDVEVSLYSAELRNIVWDFGLKRIFFFDLEDVFSQNASFSDMRSALVSDFGDSIEMIRERILVDNNALRLFNGIHRFIKEDFLVLHSHLSKNQNSLLAKETAYKTIQRSDSWSRLLKGHFPSAVRLSIHPQPFETEKFPVRLLPGKDLWGTPWHRVPLMQADSVLLIRHEEAIQQRYQLKRHLGKYTYFQSCGST